MSVLLRQPAGGFVTEPGSPYATESGPNYATTADFNGDHYPDVAVAAYASGGGVWVFRRQPRAAS